MRARRRKYDLAFQADAVALLDRTDRSIRGVAEDLGVPLGTLYAWYSKAVAKRKKLADVESKPSSARMAATDPQSDKERIAQLERELAEVRKKNEQLEMDRAILKKAAAFFAKESE
jgi:transposase